MLIFSLCADLCSLDLVVMSINFGRGSSSKISEGSPTSASQAPHGSNNDEVQDMDLEILENPNLNVLKPPKSTQRRKLRSDVWNHFEVKLDGYGTKTCVCKYCDHKYERVASKFGTGNLRRHLDSCPRKKTKDIGVVLSREDQSLTLCIFVSCCVMP